MVRDDNASGINLIQLFGVFFIRWRIIGAAIGAAFAIAFITGGVFDDPSDTGSNAVPDRSSYTATAVYGVVPVGDVAVPLGEVPRLTQALAQTYSYLIATDSVISSLLAGTELDNPSGFVPGMAQVEIIAGTAYLTISTVMDNPADAVAVANAYADALAATDAYSSINLGSLIVRLELVEPAQAATTVDVVSPGIISPGIILPLPVMLALVGLFIGVVGVLFVEWVDGRANWPGQVSARLGLSSVGSLSEQRGDVTDLEPFREAKARIKNILPRDSKGRSLLVTSARTKDGKTMVVSNLARTLAEDGSAVVILTCPLKRYQGLC